MWRPGRQVQAVARLHDDRRLPGGRERYRALGDIEDLSVRMVVYRVHGARPVAPLVTMIRLRPKLGLHVSRHALIMLVDATRLRAIRARRHGRHQLPELPRPLYPA